MELTLFDYSGAYAGFTDRVISGMFSPRFCGTGTSEYHISMSSQIVKKVMTEPFLIVSENGKQSVITGHTASDAPGEDFAIYGRTLSWFCEKTIVDPVSYSGKTADEIVKAALAEKTHGVPFVFESGGALFPDLQDYSNDSATSLSDFLSAVLEPCGGGYDVGFNGGKLTLSLKNSTDTGKYISVSNGNARSVTRTFDILDKAVAGVFRKSDGTYEKVGQDSDSGMLNWYTVLQTQNELPQIKPRDTIESEIQRMKYGKDYRLGDIFTVQFETQDHLINYKRRISGVTLNEDINGSSETPILEEV